MTLGQHIQSLRKTAGLSQEALGEALGVSRQAVSKWEADGAIPELDTLIAMSRLFGIRLGQLLQLEEVEPPSSEPPSADTQTDRLEDLLHTYAQQSQTGRKRYRMLQWSAAGLGLLVLLVGGVYIISRITRLQQNLYSLESQISTLRSSVNYEISDITNRISSALEEQDNILADYLITPTEIDVHDGTIHYSLSASLKETNAASQGQFVLNYTTTDGKTGTVKSDILNGPQFYGSVWLPYNYRTDVMLIVTDPDGTQRSQKVDVIFDAHEDYYTFSGDARMGYTVRPAADDELSFSIDGTYTVFAPYIPDSVNFDLAVEAVHMELYHNDIPVAGADMTPTEISGIDNDTSVEAAIQVVPDTFAAISPAVEDQHYGLAEPFEFTRKVCEGDVFKAVFSLTDNYGRTVYASGHSKAFEIIKEKGRFSIRPIDLTEDMLP